MEVLTPERRIRNHLLLAAGVVLTLWMAAKAGTAAGTLGRLSFVTAYQCLLLLAAALVIGPIKAWDKGRPVGNSHTRRDVGIWAVITGMIHFALANKLSMNLSYLNIFVENASRPPAADARMQLYSSGTILGYLIAVVFILLVVLSNDRMIRWVGFRWWKRLQRLAYFAFAMTCAHAFLFQILESRSRRWTVGVVLVMAGVLFAQLWGVASVRRGPMRKLDIHSDHIHGNDKPGSNT